MPRMCITQACLACTQFCTACYTISKTIRDIAKQLLAVCRPKRFKQ